MPILMEEPCVFPGDLLQEPTNTYELGISEAERVWWVIYTKSRQEKALARDLLAHRIPFYLPQVKQDLLVRKRRFRTLVPVFPGYLFLFGSPDERVDSLKTNRISRILPVVNQDELLRDLQQLSDLIALGAPLTVEQRLCAGRKARIRHGPLAGFEGTIIQRRGIDRLLIEVNFLQQGVSIEINDFMVEPIWPCRN
ncbi:MAG: antitermination protein NusG [Planctomycetaceae bacterium]|nr:MAG: antitermination protein NusG [Planctomycetaceae bacterium]